MPTQTEDATQVDWNRVAALQNAREAAEQRDAWRAIMDDAAIEASKAGASLRDIAAAIGMSHNHVALLVRAHRAQAEEDALNDAADAEAKRRATSRRRKEKTHA